jgi:regulation of enolase protein 1 (concanavalin A-like superfamily)
MQAGYRWLNEPPSWADRNGVLEVTTGDRTDFWRKTHYDFVRDDGHFRYREVSGDFTATLAFGGDYEELYDQAGLMLRIDEENWIKAGIEFVGGRPTLSAVVTRGHSDWSTMPLAGNAEWIQIRCTRQASAVRLAWSDGTAPFSLFRLAYLPASDTILVGPMCCSPQRAGFVARFRPPDVGPPSADALHD